MGGGAMIRNVARVMGAATAGAAAVAPSSPAFCHVCPQEHLINRPSALSLSQKEVCHGGSPCEIRYPSVDVIEYSSDEDWAQISYNHLVFSPPSQEEVEEATNDLNAALHLSIPSSNLSADLAAPGTENTAVVSHETVPDRQESTFLQDRMLAAGSSSNSVVQALHLFQTNPNVQSAVKSIASDPAVWRAVLSNEKVKELTENLRGGYEIPPLKISVINEEPEVSAFKKFTTKVCDFLQGKILQILNKVAEIVSSMFSSVEKAFFSKDSEIDKTVASCLMLAVAVLLVVYVKRVGK